MAIAEPEHELVVYGATGFTGGLTAEYLAANADGARWAIAGRNRSKLEATRSKLTQIDPALAELPLIEADSNDATSLRAMAESTRVVISTVGPYINYGEPLVAACAATGTDYVDLTGEPEFVDRMWLGYHAQAERSGARLVHSCGFDSIPYDLGVLYTVSQLPEGVPLSVQGYVRVSGHLLGRHLPLDDPRRSAGYVRDRASPASAAGSNRVPRAARCAASPAAHTTFPTPAGWVVPFPTIDPQTVLRSARALRSLRTRLQL